MLSQKSASRGIAITASALMMLLPGVADAHPRLVSAIPAPNATISTTNRLVLNFSEPLVGVLCGADLYVSRGGQTMKVNSVKSATSPNRKSLVLFTGTPLERGSYRLSWHAVSVDTHRVRGTINFNVR